MSTGKCTFVDLKERLSLEEVYMILEADYVHSYNKNLAEKRAYQEAERKSQTMR